MARTALLFLGIFAALMAIGGGMFPQRYEKGRAFAGSGAGMLALAIGHAVVLDQDLTRRRGPDHRGGAYVAGALICAPVTAIVYLNRTYPERAFGFVPLYLGVVTFPGLVGYGLGWLWLSLRG